MLTECQIGATDQNWQGRRLRATRLSVLQLSNGVVERPRWKAPLGSLPPLLAEPKWMLGQRKVQQKLWDGRSVSIPLAIGAATPHYCWPLLPLRPDPNCALS